MSKKNIYYVSTLLLTSTIFACKNNQIAEKVDDVIFFETSKITCNKTSPENICDMVFDYKQEKISLKFARNYDLSTNKITTRKIDFKRDLAIGFFYGQVLSSKSHLHFPTDKFIEFVKNLTIVYSNDLNKIDIEINDASKDIILTALKEFAEKNKLKDDEAFLNTLEPGSFNYKDLKQLKFISEDFSVLEAFLLEFSKKNKEDMPINS